MKRSLPIYFMLALSAVSIPSAKAQKGVPEIRFPGENHVQEKPALNAPAPTPWSDPPALRPAPPGAGAIGPSGDSIADQLNRAELSRLLGGRGGLRRAPSR
jgi:hypothetical protein